MKLTYTWASLAVASALSFISCSKEGSTFFSEDKNVKIVLSEANPLAKQASFEAVATKQEVKVPYNTEFDIVATLSPVSPIGLGQKLADTQVGTATTAALRESATYVLAAYDAAGNKVVDFDVQEGQAVAGLPAGEYSFVAVGLANGKNETVKLELPTSLKDLDLAIPASAGAMVVEKKATVSAEESTTVNLALKHLFTELTVKLDASVIGNVNAIGAATFSEGYENTNLTYGVDFEVYTKDANKKVIPFNAAVTAAAKTWNSTPFFVYAGAGTQKVGFTLEDVSIEGIAGTHTLPFLNQFTIEPGARYTLTMKLVEKTKNIKIGGLEWSYGNLLYNESSKTYYFAESQFHDGDEWYWNSLLPKRLNSSKPKITVGFSSANDPCTKVELYGGGWRLPSYEDFETLMPSGYNFSNMLVNANNKFQNSTGVFLGVTSKTNIEQSPYIFFSNLGNGLDLRYWSSTTDTNTSDNAYAILVGQDGWSGSNKSAERKDTNQRTAIRCVRNSK